METTINISKLMREKVAQGSHVNRTPLGYRSQWEAGERKLVREEPTASLVAEAFNLTGSGLSVKRTLEELTPRGLMNRNGKPLSVSSLHLVLTNPFYAGRIRFRGNEYHGSHIPVVDDMTFSRTQVGLGHRRK